MKIRLGCVDGHTYESKDFSLEEVQAGIDALDGAVWTGDLADKRTHDARQLLEELAEFARYDQNNNTQTFSLSMDNDQTRRFNVRHIVWWEIAE